MMVVVGDSVAGAFTAKVTRLLLLLLIHVPLDSRVVQISFHMPVLCEFFARVVISSWVVGWWLVP